MIRHPFHTPGYYSGGQDYYTHMADDGFDLHIDSGPRCGANCSVSDWDNYGTYSTLLYGAAAVNLIAAHDPATPLFLYLAFQVCYCVPGVLLRSRCIVAFQVCCCVPGVLLRSS